MCLFFGESQRYLAYTPLPTPAHVPQRYLAIEPLPTAGACDGARFHSRLPFVILFFALPCCFLAPTSLPFCWLFPTHCRTPARKLAFCQSLLLQREAESTGAPMYQNKSAHGATWFLQVSGRGASLDWNKRSASFLSKAHTPLLLPKTPTSRALCAILECDTRTL